MPEVKRSPATPDKSLSHSRCNLANRDSQILRLVEKSASLRIGRREKCTAALRYAQGKWEEI